MATINILFGTESGNAELVADDIAEAFNDADIDAQVVDMEDFDVTELPTAGTVVVITSTYGEGELPATTQPFEDALVAQKPDLTGLRFAAFGLGDSSYETYNNAIGILTKDLIALGAVQLGETGRHDAVSGDSFTDVASTWAKTILDLL
ncbi:nitric oxide synthase [Mycolicibacterium sp. P9-64]|uniref:flavodoxin domain-containing protein n=1 Tax=Mycolicibacterium sp. P9-64 TaxID=2024612 RepID=UPI0011EE4A70|nr:flavodoxin domain-containing protein [Mycolicibacterium sp. P9-64]KAA0084536.1 nitric oxide synthase [Mycolicibacterium sp. P9-64]